MASTESLRFRGVTVKEFPFFKAFSRRGAEVIQLRVLRLGEPLWEFFAKKITTTD